MQSKLLENIRTVEEANVLSDEISLLLDALGKTKKGNYEEMLEVNVHNWVREIIKMETEKIEDRNTYFQEVLNNIENLEKIKITIAFELSNISIQNLFDWVQKNVSKGVIVDLEIDKTIIGGAIISYKGKYYDGTLGRKFGEDIINPKPK